MTDVHFPSPEQRREALQAKSLKGLGANLLGMSLREPPSNLEAEQALLGALLANNDAFAAVSDFLRPEHFADGVHAVIYERIATRIAAGEVADAITLRADLEGSGELDPAGGAGYLAELLSAMVSPKVAGQYGRVILDCWMRREVISACEMAAVAAFGAEPGLAAGTLIERIRDDLLKVERDLPSQARTFSIGRAVQDAIDAGAAVAARGGGLSGASCGFPDLDRVIGGLEPGTNTILAARPGVGKSALGLQMALRMAHGGLRVLYVSLEMSAAQMGRRALSLISRVPLADLRSGAFTRDDGLAEDVVRSRQVFERMPLLIEDEPRLTYQAIAARARTAQRKLGRLDALFIDHLHILGRDDRMARLNDAQAIAEQSAGIRAIGQRMGIPLITLAQLNRGVESREDKRPTLADLRGSGSVEQDADTIGFIYRPEMGLRDPEKRVGETDHDYARRVNETQQKRADVTGKAFVIFDKVRDGETQQVELRFDARRVRFHQIDE